MRTYFLPLLALFFFILPAFAYAALININTADAALLETLPGIGPSKAAAIIDYRTQHGPFAQIQDIQNVSGIGPSTYANIESLITVGASSGGSGAPAATSTESSPSFVEYIPPPSALTVELAASKDAIMGVPSQFSARALVKGDPYLPARIFWSFGDGSRAEGGNVQKSFQYAGSYVVVASAEDGSVSGRAEVVVSVRPAQARILAVSQEGVLVQNDMTTRLDLSDWRLSAGGSSFTVPSGTVILPKSAVLFSREITGLPSPAETTLFHPYPSNRVAAAYSFPRIPHLVPGVQPPAPAEGSYIVQTVEPANSILSSTAHETAAADAPVAATELAAAGAALPEEDSASLLKSPWFISLLGVIALAGGAFILL